jgi:hypothetical protein
MISRVAFISGGGEICVHRPISLLKKGEGGNLAAEKAYEQR